MFCLFVDSLGWVAPAQADLKVITVSHMIYEFKFQQTSLYLYNNTTRWIHCYVE